jgi:hypothetical protein
MFTFETLLETYEKTAKTALSHMQPESVKTALLDLTDRQLAFAKSVSEQSAAATEYVTKHAKETAAKFFPTK